MVLLRCEEDVCDLGHRHRASPAVKRCSEKGWMYNVRKRRGDGKHVQESEEHTPRAEVDQLIYSICRVGWSIRQKGITFLSEVGR